MLPLGDERVLVCRPRVFGYFARKIPSRKDALGEGRINSQTEPRRGMDDLGGSRLLENKMKN